MTIMKDSLIQTNGPVHYTAYTAEDAAIIELTLQQTKTPFAISKGEDPEILSLLFTVFPQNPAFEQVKISVIDRSMAHQDLHEQFTERQAYYENVLSNPIPLDIIQTAPSHIGDV